MKVTEFLEARISEDEERARAACIGIHGEHKDAEDWGGYVLGLDRDSTVKQDAFITEWWPGRILAECAAKRTIIRQHQEWPVLVERELEMEEPIADFQGTVIRMHREVMWLTEREYVRRFGTEPPTAPMIRTLAAVYKGHPDYQAEWSA